MNRRKEIAEYINEVYMRREQWQLDIAKELGITQEQVSLITSNLDYFRGKKEKNIYDYSFINGNEFDFLDTVKLSDKKLNITEMQFKDFLISDDKSKIQIDIVCELLNSTYWAKDRTKDIIEKSIENSICFGIYLHNKQIGFARCVTDFVTIYWLADVIIDNEYRKLGLSISCLFYN